MQIRTAAALFCFALFAANPCHAGDEFKKFRTDPSFLKKDRDQKLGAINDAIVKKVFRSWSADDYVARLVWEELAGQKDIHKKLDAYRNIFQKYPKLPRASHVERTLFAIYLIEDPGMQKASALDRVKQLNALLLNKTFGWVQIGSLMDGLLLTYIASPEFSSLSAMDKALKLNQLKDGKYYHSTTASNFITGFAFQELSKMDAAKRKASFEEMKKAAGFFSRSDLESAFPECAEK